MPYFGMGADDLVALRIVLQLAENPGVTATIVHYESEESIETYAEDVTPTKPSESKKMEILRVLSLGTKTESTTGGPSALFTTLRKAMSADMARRVVFDTVRHSKDPVQDALAQAQQEVGQNSKNGGDIIVVGRNVKHFKQSGSTSSITSDCLGTAADTFAGSGIKASLLVVQAKDSGLAS